MLIPKVDADAVFENGDVDKKQRKKLSKEEKKARDAKHDLNIDTDSEIDSDGDEENSIKDQTSKVTRTEKEKIGFRERKV